MSRAVAEISLNNFGPFDPNSVLSEGTTLDTHMRGGIKQFIRNTLTVASGPIQQETIGELITAVADQDEDYPFYSAHPFRYAATPELPELGLTCTAESTVAGALGNMHYILGRSDPRAFASDAHESRKLRALQWQAPIDESYALRLRGGSGAGTLSFDLGIGTYDPERHWHYNELWRSGFDSVSADGQTGIRFIRTGSGVKPDDEAKIQAFDRFRKTYGLLPQRLLAMVGLYYARELQPDYALALTTQGARQFSTLGKSTGDCDYTGIFENVGFRQSEDPSWSIINNFSEGFYEALHHARIRRREGDILSTVVQALNSAQSVDALGRKVNQVPPPVQLCSDERTETLEREVQVHMRPAAPAHA